MILFINNFITQIQAPIGADDTTISLPATEYAKLASPADGDYYCAALNNGESIEYIHIVEKLDSPNVRVERAKEGSTAIVCDMGDTISVVNTADMYKEFYQKNGVISTPKINEAVPLQATSSQLDDAVSNMIELKSRDFTVPDADGLISVNTLVALNGTEIITY